jgi:hypothetical protein
MYYRKGEERRAGEMKQTDRNMRKERHLSTERARCREGERRKRLLETKSKRD